MTNIKKIFGIDSLYFFCESNEEYDNLYLEILDQIETVKGLFSKRDIAYEKKDINILINDITLQYLGRSNGFTWFKDVHEFFKIGFKDKNTNRGLNDISVQLLGNGIYTLGINSIIDLIKSFLKEYITGYIPVTRVDLNCFIQSDMSFISKEMFASKKKKYSVIQEIGSANSVQTIYVGKEPFKLRLYNKSLELSKSKKQYLMEEYFLNNGFDLEGTIFNVEFQMHRTYLKQFKIDSIEDLFSNAVKLFRNAMDEIRLLDMDSVSKERLKSNKYQALTHPLWNEIKEEYTLTNFLQSSLPLERIKRKVSIYCEKKFHDEYIGLLRKAIINNINLDTDFLELLYNEAKDSFKKEHQDYLTTKKHSLDIDIYHDDGNIEKLKLFDGKLMKPLTVVTVSNLDDYELLVYIDKTRKKQYLSTRDKDIHYTAVKESEKRGLTFNFEGKDLL